MVAFVVPDFPWWFVFVLAAMSVPWWAGITLLGATLPRPPARCRTRAAAAVATTVVYALAAAAVSELVLSTTRGWRLLDVALWTLNGAAATFAAGLMVVRRRRRR